MYFVITLMAAIVSTVIWYKFQRRAEFKLGTLCLIYWGASIMWAVDLLIAFGEEGLAAFETGIEATFLGILVVALGLGIWTMAVIKSRRTTEVRYDLVEMESGTNKNRKPIIK